MKAPDATTAPKIGRPPGTPNKFAAEARELAAASGLLPHEILLKFARGESVLRVLPVVDPSSGGMHTVREWVTPSLEQMIQCAKEAAPYYAPKFGTIEFSKDLTDEEFRQLAAYYASGDAAEGDRPGAAEEAAVSPEGAEAPGGSVPPPDAAIGRRRLRR